MRKANSKEGATAPPYPINGRANLVAEEKIQYIKRVQGKQAKKREEEQGTRCERPLALPPEASEPARERQTSEKKGGKGRKRQGKKEQGEEKQIKKRKTKEA